MAEFLTLLKLAPYGDGKNWCVLEDFKYEANDGTIIIVPAGFITDFASVPREFWGIIPPWGKYGPAAILHDFLYYDQSTTKNYADMQLLEGMKSLGVEPFYIKIIFEAVEHAGMSSWIDNRIKREKGFIRVAQELPKSLKDLPFYWEGNEEEK